MIIRLCWENIRGLSSIKVFFSKKIETFRFYFCYFLEELFIKKILYFSFILCFLNFL